MDISDNDGSVLYRHQYYDLVGRRRVLDGESALMFAVLRNGIASYLTNKNPKTPEQRRAFAQVRRWMDADEDGVFSYAVLCDAFGIDPAALRNALQELHGHKHERLRNTLARKAFIARSSVRSIELPTTSPSSAKKKLAIGKHNPCPHTDI